MRPPHILSRTSLSDKPSHTEGGAKCALFSCQVVAEGRSQVLPLPEMESRGRSPKPATMSACATAHSAFHSMLSRYTFEATRQTPSMPGFKILYSPSASEENPSMVDWHSLRLLCSRSSVPKATNCVAWYSQANEVRRPKKS
jgi:hypothetical protein